MFHDLNMPDFPIRPPGDEPLLPSHPPLSGRGALTAHGALTAQGADHTRGADRRVEGHGWLPSKAQGKGLAQVRPPLSAGGGWGTSAPHSASLRP